MKRILIASLMAAILTSLAGVIIEGDGSNTSGYQIGSETALRSKVLGEAVPVRVYLPPRYAHSEERYPTLYVLEGDLYSRALTGIIETRARCGSSPDMIVVEIGTSDRWRDFTPTRAGIPGREVIASSGASARHRRFLAEELIPWIEGEFRTEPCRILFGHSIAGLHAITTMFEMPGLFAACIATSPSLWWDQEWAAKMAARALESGAVDGGSLFLAYGNEGETIEVPLRRFRDLLEAEAPPAFHWTLTAFPGTNHQEVPLAAFNSALAFVFGGWILPDDLLATGLAAVESHYERLSHRLGYRIPVPERILNALGYRALNAGCPRPSRGRLHLDHISGRVSVIAAHSICCGTSLRR